MCVLVYKILEYFTKRFSCSLTKNEKKNCIANTLVKDDDCCHTIIMSNMKEDRERECNCIAFEECSRSLWRA